MNAAADHFVGRFLSVLIPFAEGPRQCGQFSASAASGFGETTLHVTSSVASVR